MQKFYTTLLVSLLGLPAMAQEVATENPLDFTVGGITYTILDDNTKTCQTKAGDSKIVDRTLQIIYGNEVSGEITIPAKVMKDGSEEYTVVAIGSYGFKNASTVTIETGGVTSINASAFSGNALLTSIVIPEDVVTIGSYAFSGCSGLESVSLPSGITSIANSTFVSSGLSSITIPENVAYIGDNAFALCKNLKAVKIPDNVLQLGKNVFQGCTGVTSLTLSSSLTSIPANAFQGCQLTSLTIPANVSSIGEYAFSCNTLQEVVSENTSIPAISYNSFNATVYANATLKVYKSALSAYQKSSLWKNFTNIAVIEVPVEGISISQTSLNLTLGLSSQLKATLTPEEATGDITWSVSSTVEGSVTVDDTGKVTAHKIGTATVTATSGDYSASCDVTVLPNSSESVKINPLTQTLYAGDKVGLTAIVFPSTITPTLVWSSSNESVATINESTGELTAIAPGATVITATNDNISGKLAITVYEVLPTAITLDQETVTLEVGDSETLTATVTPENVTYPAVTWETSDPNIVIVSEGKITAMGVGAATIRAMCGGLTANCNVTVNPTDATGVELSQSTASLKVSQSLQLTATLTPENTTNKTILWTSGDESVASVTNEGVVTAFSLGTATITATWGVLDSETNTVTPSNVSATCEVTVEATPSEAVVLNVVAVTLRTNQTQQLVATVLPDDTTDKSVTWESSDETIATVEDGLVTAVGIGNATITATNGNLSAACEVTVEATPVEQVIIEQGSANVNVGESVTLTAIVIPEDASDRTVTWTSTEESVATVSETGVVTGVKSGTTVIVATCGEAFASCVVTVLQPATAIQLNETALELEIGEIYDLIETVTPEDTTDVVAWSSSNTDVAIVDENGIVTALAGGEAIITATAGEVSATCTVTVKDEDSDAIEEVSSLEGEVFTVYSVQGIKLMENTGKAALQNLTPDIYIVNGKKVYVK